MSVLYDLQHLGAEPNLRWLVRYFDHEWRQIEYLQEEEHDWVKVEAHLRLWYQSRVIGYSIDDEQGRLLNEVSTVTVEVKHEY
jgi:hypothetical protein